MTDPKQAAGELKAPLCLLPRVFVEAVAWALKTGATKYGAWNWRKTEVPVATYISASLRHLHAYADGEDIDPESGLSHLAHVGANVAIILDAARAGTLVDDRPEK